MAYTPGELTGTFHLPDGSAREGSVYVWPSVTTIRDAEGDVILSGRVKTTLDEGTFTLSLPPSDDPDLNPSGFTFNALVVFKGSDRLSFANIEIPAGGTVDLVDVGNPDPSAPTYLEWVNAAEVAAGEADASATTAAASALAAGEAAATATGAAESAGDSEAAAAGSAVAASASASAAQAAQTATEAVLDDYTPTASLDDTTAALVANPASETGTALTAAIDASAMPAIEALVPGSVADAVDGHIPGSSVGYIERGSTTTSTDTTATAIPSMTVTVVGTGRPVEVEWYVPGPYHSVPNTVVTLGIQYQRAGVYQGYLTIGSAGRSPSTTGGDTTIIKRQIVLDNGVTYAFYPVMAGGAVGTSNLGISGSTLSYLSVVSR